MNITIHLFKEGNPQLSLNWNCLDKFEESVINEIFGDSGVLAFRTANCIRLEKCDIELSKIINKYLDKKLNSEKKEGLK